MSDDRVATHPISLFGYDPRVRVAFGVGLTQCPDLANTLAGHYCIDRIGKDLAVRRNCARSRLSPGHCPLQLIVLNAQIDRIRDELEVLAEGVAVWCCDDALDLFVARIDVDHTAGESEGARALP